MTIILQIAIPVAPLRRLFDYYAPAGVNPAQLQPGARVQVPWRNRSCIGILITTASHSSLPPHKLKTAEKILDIPPLLPTTLVKLAEWAAAYYYHSPGEVLECFFPKLLRSKEKYRYEPPAKIPWQTVRSPHTLNTAQQQGLTTLQQQNQFQTFLLDGVTGSGKTEIYLQIIAKQIAESKQALVLVPEIGLTPQTLSRFTSRFKAPIAVLHSGLTEKERLQSWLMAKHGDAAIVIGTRSAIFTPLANPGIIIIDEEHDLSFKQQSGFRYSARDCAIVRAQLENIPIVLGTATPALESLYNVTRKQYLPISLPQRSGSAVLPQFRLIDIRKKPLTEGLSLPLLELIKQHLAKNNQVLLFLNRRGFAPLLLCHQCGWMAKCSHCSARLTLHQHSKKLHCHHCGTQSILPSLCPSCHSKEILLLGLGTERLEAALSRFFPDVDIIRIDRDSTRRKGALAEKLAAIQAGKKQILVGTQMLTKGHHFPDVTLVAIVDADHYLFSNDFRANERFGQLLIQVSGRAGRAEKPGEVCIQTHFPDHPLLQQLLSQGYSHYAQALLKERQQTQLPPFSYHALLRAEAKTFAEANAFLQRSATSIQKSGIKEIQVLGPMPAPLEKKAGYFRLQLLLQATQRSVLHKLLKIWIPLLENDPKQSKVRWSLDVDPLEMG